MRLALCLEQTLGHRAHSANLVNALQRGEVELDVVKIEFDAANRLPWAVRGSWQAAELIRSRPAHDVRFFHTQSVSLFAPIVAGGKPYVVSVDATPTQIDGMGRWYAHRRSVGILERVKRRWYEAVFSRAAAVVAWSDWAALSLSNEYGVDARKIATIHPGAPRALFEIERPAELARTPTILFVGSDLKRKGGDLLLDVFARLPSAANLLMVTPDSVAPMAGLEVIANAKPGSPEIIDAYRRADIFCLPTRGDCTPVVLGEAMAAALPVVTTRIGSNDETVSHGSDGFLVNVNAVGELETMLRALLADAALRTAMGGAARAKAIEKFDAEKNAHRLLALLRSVTK
jgi:glycosyltransferase involved in cell wall biosynthesis